tara:strand:- start:41 stop:226 length:186 start_codon:yes stop_codon:yes gene_type:complete
VNNQITELPLFMIMGFTNGMMMGQMMALTDMNYQMMTQGMDYAYLDILTQEKFTSLIEFND